MDILGKQGEKAHDELESIGNRIEELESHIDAVDTALNDFMERSVDLMADEKNIEAGELGRLEEIFEQLQTETGKIETVEERISEVERRQDRPEKNMEALMDSGLLETVSGLKEELETLENDKDRMDEIEGRIEDLENRFVVEVNSREFDFDQKLDRKTFESRERDIYEELKKLRTSVNVLAEDLDSKEKLEHE